MSVKLLTEHNLEFLSLKGACTGSPESTHVKMPHCCKSQVVAQIKLPSRKKTLTWFNSGVTASSLLSKINNTGGTSVFLNSNKPASLLIVC